MCDNYWNSVKVRLLYTRLKKIPQKFFIPPSRSLFIFGLLTALNLFYLNPLLYTSSSILKVQIYILPFLFYIFSNKIMCASMLFCVSVNKNTFFCSFVYFCFSFSFPGFWSGLNLLSFRGGDALYRILLQNTDFFTPKYRIYSKKLWQVWGCVLDLDLWSVITLVSVVSVLSTTWILFDF